MDSSAAVNRLRVALEAPVDAHVIARHTLDKRQKTREAVPARLIGSIPRQEVCGGRLTDGLKWLGNDASHQDVLRLSDALEAAELMEHALEIVYADRKSKPT